MITDSAADDDESTAIANKSHTRTPIANGIKYAFIC